LVEVWQEEIDLEGELQMRRRERVATLVGSARAEEQKTQSREATS